MSLWVGYLYGINWLTNSRCKRKSGYQRWRSSQTRKYLYISAISYLYISDIRSSLSSPLPTLEYTIMKTWYYICIWNFVYGLSTSWDFQPVCLQASDFQPPFTLCRLGAYIVESGTLEMPDHENMAFASGILLISGHQHAIHVVPVLAVAILDFWTFNYISRILKIRIELNLYLLLCHEFFVCTNWIRYVTTVSTDRPML